MTRLVRRVCVAPIILVILIIGLVFWVFAPDLLKTQDAKITSIIEKLFIWTEKESVINEDS